MYTICTPAFFVRNNSVSVLCGSYKKRKSMKTKITLLLLCLSSISYTQNPQWLNQEHIKDRDTFRKSVFVNSSSGGVVVNFLQQQTEQQGGGSNIPDRRFLFAYGENGNALWSFETNQINIFDLLVKEEGAFWLVGFGTGEVHIGNQTITSPQPYPQNRSLYFIEINSSGVVVDYFVYTLSFDIFPLLADVVFDQNGDFVILATIHPDQILPIPFEFGNFNTTLDPDERLHIVAKMDTEGNPGEIFTYTSPRFIPTPTFPQHLAVNSDTGEIIFTGRMGSTLTIGNTTHTQPSVYQQLYLGLLDSDYTLITTTAEEISTYGTLVYEVSYNPVTSSFYLLGTWGDTLYYGQSQPLSGHTGTVENMYLAQITPETTSLNNLISFIPQNHEFSSFISFLDMQTAANGSIYLCGTVTDSEIAINGELHQIQSGSPLLNYESLVVKISPTFEIASLLNSQDEGNSIYRSIVIDDENIYCSGDFLNDFHFGNLTAMSVGGSVDGIIVKLTDPELSTNNPVATPERVSVFPNPTFGIIHFQTQVAIDAVLLYDISGKRTDIPFITSEKILNISTLPSGVYFAHIIAEGHTQIQKIIKK